MFGPDGKPINIGAGQLIGGPKTLDDVVPFNDDTITALENGALQLLQSGQPMEVPAAMPMGQIVQIAKTLSVQRERIKELEAAQTADQALLARGLDTLRFSMAEVVHDPQENWPAIMGLAESLRDHLEPSNGAAGDPPQLDLTGLLNTFPPTNGDVSADTE